MIDATALLDRFLGPQAARAGADLIGQAKQALGERSAGGGFGAGAALGGIAGLLLGSKSGRKIGGTALQVGGMAVVAGLAYKAYRDWQTGGAAPGATGASAAGPMAIPAPPSDSGFSPQRAPGGEQAFALELIRAMIAAAKSDGHIDAEEQGRIFARLDEAGLGVEEKAFVIDELRAPLDIEKVVAAARTPEAAVELYTASRIAIEPDRPAEQAYLGMLAARLDLAPDLVERIDAAVRGAQESGSA